MDEPVNIPQWLSKNSGDFAPPICNKLLYKGQLSVMFVGGPNTREDFHVEEGSEFFWQMKGNMKLPTIQDGKLKVVEIKEGDVFCLPSRVPHSPQRPEEGSIGLVIERRRIQGEYDCLRFYTDFNKCEEILWQKEFVCNDLGKDLVPVVKEFLASDESKTRIPQGMTNVEHSVSSHNVSVPDPFSLTDWIRNHERDLDIEGSSLALFDDHPDKEFKIFVEGTARDEDWRSTLLPDLETAVYQLEGSSELTLENQPDKIIVLNEADWFVIPANIRFKLTRSIKAKILRIEQSSNNEKNSG